MPRNAVEHVITEVVLYLLVASDIVDACQINPRNHLQRQKNAEGVASSVR